MKILAHKITNCVASPGLPSNAEQLTQVVEFLIPNL